MLAQMFESNEEAFAYLSGLIDGEGSVRLYRTKTGAAGRINIYNSEIELIKAAEEAFWRLGIEPTVKLRKPDPSRLGKKDQYILTVGKRSDIAKASKVLTLYHPQKKKNMNEILEHYQSVQGRWTPRDEWPLAELSKVSNLPQRELATKFGVSQSTIQRWLKEL